MNPLGKKKLNRGISNLGKCRMSRRKIQEKKLLLLNKFDCLLRHLNQINLNVNRKAVLQRGMETAGSEGVQVTNRQMAEVVTRFLD